MRQLYRDKWHHFQARVTEKLGGRLAPIAESAGMHLVLKGNVDDLALSQQLRGLGFGSTALSEHYIGKTVQTGLVMGFASASESQIEACVDALCRLTDYDER